MEQYTLKIKNLINNFSFQELENLLIEIDNEILSRKINRIDEEFLYYFEIIMSFISDNNIINKEYIELGHMLLDKQLKERKKIGPTLLIYFYLEQKRKIGLSNHCNNIIIDNFEFYMGITQQDDGHNQLKINLGLFKKEYKTIEEYNYFMLQIILHEIVHIYQNTRNKNSDDLFEQIVFYDNLCIEIIIRNILGGVSGAGVVHDSLICEFMAEENADIYMFEIAKNNPEYFSKELIERKKIAYKQKKNSDILMYNIPRIAFEEFLEYSKNIYRGIGIETYEEMKPIFEQIEEILKIIKPLVEKLKEQGISEDVKRYNYYNIYLDQYYHYDGQEIIFEPQGTKTK